MRNFLIFVAKRYLLILFAIITLCTALTCFNIPFYPLANLIGFVLSVFVAIVAAVARVIRVQ